MLHIHVLLTQPNFPRFYCPGCPHPLRCHFHVGGNNLLLWGDASVLGPWVSLSMLSFLGPTTSLLFHIQKLIWYGRAKCTDVWRVSTRIWSLPPSCRHHCSPEQDGLDGELLEDRNVMSSLLHPQHQGQCPWHTGVLVPHCSLGSPISLGRGLAASVCWPENLFLRGPEMTEKSCPFGCYLTVHR